MKQAALGKSIPKSPNSWDDEQTPVLERGSAISSELCRVELGEAGEGVGLAPTSSSPRSHLQSAWSCWRCSDWGTWVLHAGSTAGDGGRSLYLTKAPSRVKTSCTPSVMKGPICPFSLTVLQTHRQQSPFSRRVLSAASMSRASPCLLLDHTPAQASPSHQGGPLPFPEVSVQTTTCLFRPMWTATALVLVSNFFFFFF